MQTGYQQQFGGDWTEVKLETIRKYLQAYTQIMKNRPYTYAYIDAFAGTGYVLNETKEEHGKYLLPLLETESQKFMEGSARIALRVEPPFSRYIFIEKDPQRFKELTILKDEFPHLSDRIRLENKDANEYLQELCNKNWKRHRAVIFLDPFGMQVDWKTLEAIANAQAIDLWLLFPLGVAVNRMLKKDGKIPQQWAHRLDRLFGTTDWIDAFYEERKMLTLFGEQLSTEKVEAPFDSISRYFVERLKTIFPENGVADNPLPLYNSRKNPLYLLCFACANPNVKSANNIAKDILRR